MSRLSHTLEEKADILAGNVSGWETSTLERIGRRIKSRGKMNISDVQIVNNITDVKQDMEAITKELARVTGMNISEIHKMYGEVIAAQHEANRKLYDYRGKVFVPFAENRELKSLVKAFARNTGGTMINLAKTSALFIVDEHGHRIGFQKYYTDVLDRAVMQVSSGAANFHTAMRDVIRELGGSGVRVDYGGFTRHLDSVVRQNIMWGAKQVSNQYNEMIGEELGCDGIEVDWHEFPRPSHEFMQGKQYVIGKARTINGVRFDSANLPREKMKEYGCNHYETAIICGVSEPTYSPEQLEELNARNRRTFNINGKEVTGYEASQMMRRLETGVRREKGIRDLARSSGDALQVRRSNARIAAYKRKYEEISEITGIPQDTRRMSVTRAKKKVTEGLKSEGNSGIIDTKKISNVSTGGKRNEKPLTESQIRENIQYAEKLGMPRERIRYGEHYNTAYGSEFDMLYIGTDVYPSATRAKFANGRVSNKGAIAHEIIGHREAFKNGWQQADSVLDEIQASIRAARFAPDLTDTERYVLLRDAAERAKGAGYKLKDVQTMLNISER